MEQIISLKYDFSFKYLFLNEKVRPHFISDALGVPPKKIISVRLAKTIRALHEALMKEIRVRNARENYVRSEGEDRLNRLYLSLIEDKRSDDLEKAVRDKRYRKQLYREYGI